MGLKVGGGMEKEKEEEEKIPMCESIGHRLMDRWTDGQT